MGQYLNNFTVESDLQDGGANHKDLVVAYTDAHRTGTSGMRVPLTFHHALSQIAVRIKKGNGFETGRKVRVKGAWIMNVHSTGNLEFDLKAPNNMRWSTSTPAKYGRLQANGTALGEGDGLSIISNDEGGGNSTLMVLPQRFIKYQFPNSSSTVVDDVDLKDVPNYNNAGTYILILCRVETEHFFPLDGTEITAVGEIDGGHVHQLFPVVKDASGQLVYDQNAYGYSCVPIEGNWEPGKKYIYTLEFCGKNSGAGVYPPDDLPDDLPKGEDRPGDKKPGDPVLDSPITFKVEVSDWSEQTETTPMP